MTDLNSVTERQRFKLILTSFSLSKVFIWELLLCHSDILSQFSAILSLTCRRVGGKIHFHFKYTITYNVKVKLWKTKTSLPK